MARALLTAAVVALAACGRADSVQVAPAPEEPVPTAVVAERDVQPVPAAAREGWIARSTLTSVLDRGVGAFLAEVRVEAVLDGGAFVGWRVLRYDNEWVDVRPGDVLLSVNDQPIETPAQVQALWDSLYEASAIEARLQRGDETFAIRFRVGEPAAVPDAGAGPGADAGAAP